MIKDLKKKAYNLFLEWEKTYRKEARECDYKALDWVYCDEEVRDDKKKYQKDIHAALQGQIDFIKYHVALMTFPGPTIENLDRIEQFLSMQHLVDEYFPEGESPPITITFWGGSPVCARVHAQELSDIDFEDSYADLYFSTICISDRDCKKWTLGRIGEVIQEIKQDMEFDGDEVELELELDWGLNKPGNHEIALCCSVKEFGVDIFE
jgi:hypothetical protein